VRKLSVLYPFSKMYIRTSNETLSQNGILAS